MRFIFSLLLLTLTGCSSLYTANPSPRPAKELSPEVSSSLACPASYSFTKLETQHEEETWRVESDNFSMQYQYLRSYGSSKKDLVIIFNILKDKHQTVSGWLATNLTAMNYDCLIIQQEDFLSRKELRPILPDGGDRLDWDAYFSKNLQHLSLIINHWIPQQEHLSGKYSFVGVSMGGILAVGAAACFPEAKVTIAIMAGGDGSQVIMESQEPLVKREREALIRHYSTRRKTKAAIITDISNLNFNILKMARCVETNSIKQIISLYDTQVPTNTQWNLYHALGEPEVRTYPTGHISLGIFAWSVRDQIIKWLGDANRTR
jgi:hypothetical protein